VWYGESLVQVMTISTIFSQKREEACWEKPGFGEARIQQAVERFQIISQLLTGRQLGEMVAWIFRPKQGPNFHMETNGGICTNKTVK